MSDYKKTRKNKGKKTNNVVPLKKDLQVISNDNPVDAKQVEIDRLNDHVREAFKNLAEFTDGCKLNNSEMWYNILYFAKQRAIHTIPYAEFKINDKNSSLEVTENYVKFYNENYPELFTSKEKNRKLHQGENMTDKTKYRNVSPSHETYGTLQQLSKVLLPGATLSISKTVESVANEYQEKLKNNYDDKPIQS